MLVANLDADLPARRMDDDTARAMQVSVACVQAAQAYLLMYTFIRPT